MMMQSMAYTSPSILRFLENKAGFQFFMKTLVSDEIRCGKNTTQRKPF